MIAKALSSFLVLSLAVFSGMRLGRAQDAQDAPPGFDPQAMAEAMKLAAPGPEHEALAKKTGEWTTEVSIYSPMMPDMEPMKTTGTATARTILGGRFLEVVSRGAFMGQPFESVGIMGFDRRHGEYTTIGLDTLGTYWVTGKGKRGEDGVIRMHGEDEDLMGKQVYTFEHEEISEDVHVDRVVFKQIGPRVFEEPFTMVTVRSTRKTD